MNKTKRKLGSPTLIAVTTILSLGSNLIVVQATLKLLAAKFPTVVLLDEKGKEFIAVVSSLAFLYITVCITLKVLPYILYFLDNFLDIFRRFFILDSEFEVHYEERVEEIRTLEKRRIIANFRIALMLIFEMYILAHWDDIIWLPHLSKVWLFFKTQVIVLRSRL